MDPEQFTPVILVFLGVVGAAARRFRGSDTSTAGQRLGSAGAATSLGTATVIRWGGRLTADLASEVVAVGGAMVSGAAGLVVDGADSTVGAVGSRVVSRVTSTLFPRGDKFDAGPVALEHAAEVVAAPRGKRFHRSICALAPEGGLTLAREAAVGTGRRPCPTCRP